MKNWLRGLYPLIAKIRFFESAKFKMPRLDKRVLSQSFANCVIQTNKKKMLKSNLARRLLIWLSWLGVMEISSTITPLWFIALFLHLTIARHFMLLRLCLDAGAVYLMVSYVLASIHQSRSRKMGLRYFYIAPAQRTLVKMLVRGRLKLPDSNSYYLVHINDSIHRKNARDAIEDMRADLKLLSTPEMSGAVFVGNTFAEFGSLHRKQMQAFAECQETKGTLLPLQTYWIATALIRHQQRKIFGRSYAIRKPEWRIVLLKVN